MISLKPSLRIKLFRRSSTTLTVDSEVCHLPYYDDIEPWYLTKYLSEVGSKYGEVKVVDKLGGEYKFMRNYNLIYPVGGGIFIHVISEKGERGYPSYRVVEPPRPQEKVLSFVEEKLARVIPENYTPKSTNEKICVLTKLIEEVFKREGKAIVKYLHDGIPAEEFKNLVVYHMVRNKIGVGAIEPFLRDPYLEDISCSGLGNIYVVHKYFGSMESNVGFISDEDLNAFLINLAEKIGKPLSNARPIVDATLPDGSRINIVFGADVSLRGSNFTVRKIPKTPVSVTQLISWGTFDTRVAAYMWMLLREGMSGFICGETASGKTTSLTALLPFIKSSAKIVSIEDTAEVVVPHANWVRELTRDTGRPESSVTMFDLLRSALRQRPNYIIVGEIRGAEGAIAFQAIQTGHPVLSTFHASDIDTLIQRLTNNPINIPKTNIGALNFAWFQTATYTKEGFLARKMVKLYEVVGYYPQNDSIVAIPVFVWDPIADKFTFSGRGTSYLLEEKIAVMKGIPRSRIKEIYEELELRAEFLNRLVKEGVFNYWDVWKAVIKVEEVGLEKAIELLNKKALL